MDLNAEIWNVINSKPRIPTEVKKSLHLEIMRLINEELSNPLAKKLNVTMMTPEASLAGNKVAADRNAEQNPGQPRPKTI